MFIDREQELAFLESKWRERCSQLLVLYGKRRVGKTELVKRFIRDKPAVYFLAESTNEAEQLRRFSQALGRFFGEPLLATRGFAGWEELFAYVRERNKRMVLAIDEFPYLIVSNPAIPGLFQKAWDEYWKDGHVCLVLTGSSVSMMENEVLGHRSPLFGRRTGQWRVEPLPFAEATRFRAGKPFDDRLAHYALAGGIPAYWLRLHADRAFEGNLAAAVLTKGEPLYEEVPFLLREELREPRYYFALLQAIAHGKRKLSEIVNATGLPQPVANKYLGVLADLRIVERETPITEERPLKSKKGLYRIADAFVRFWFRFVFPYRDRLEMGRVHEVLEEIRPHLVHHFAETYEAAAPDIYMAHIRGDAEFARVGRWWERENEIDLVALSPSRNSILFGEVKWSARPVGLDIYDALVRKARLVSWGAPGRTERFVILSRSGFTPALLDRARADQVALFHGDRPVTHR